MARDNPVSRRTALKLTGAAASTALVAGCSGGSDDGNGNGNGNGNGSGSETFTIESGSTIMLKADGQTWVGSEPSKIADVESPTLELTEGGSYTIGWEQNEGGHNIALYNGDGNVYSGKKTSVVNSTGEGQTLEFTASSEIAEYVCVPHYQSEMKGTIKVTGSGSSDGGNESSE